MPAEFPRMSALGNRGSGALLCPEFPGRLVCRKLTSRGWGRCDSKIGISTSRPNRSPANISHLFGLVSFVLRVFTVLKKGNPLRTGPLPLVYKAYGHIFPPLRLRTSLLPLSGSRVLLPLSGLKRPGAAALRDVLSEPLKKDEKVLLMYPAPASLRPWLISEPCPPTQASG